MRRPLASYLASVLVPVALATLGVGAARAGATAEPQPDLAMASRRGFVGRGIVDPTASPDQLVARSIRPGREARFLVVLRNTGYASGDLTISGSGDADGYTVRYVDEDGLDVTPEVTSGSHVVQLDPGRRTYLHVLITAPAPGTVDTGDRHTVWVRATDEGSGVSDLVRGRVEVPPIRVWSSSFDGRLRCTATFPHRIWRPGGLTDVEVRLTNLTDRRLAFTRPTATLSFRDEHSDKLGDTRPPPFPMPYPGTIELPPGATTRIDVWTTRVRWSGALSVMVHCGAGRFAMPAPTIHVADTAPLPSVEAAIDAAVAVPGSPWQACHPGPDGEPATGVFETPDGRDLPPMTLRCWATVRAEAGFHVVSLHLVAPDDAPAYRLGETDPFRIQPEPADDAPNFLAARWGFVVTADGVKPYSITTQVKALGDGTSVGYTLRSDGSWRASGGGTCGYYGFGWSATGRGLWLDWITGCMQSATSSGVDTVEASRTIRVGAGYRIVQRVA